MIINGETRIAFDNTSGTSSVPEEVVMVLVLDGIAQEGNKTYSVMLVPSSGTSVPEGESIFFRDEIDVTIVDRDG